MRQDLRAIGAASVMLATVLLIPGSAEAQMRRISIKVADLLCCNPDYCHTPLPQGCTRRPYIKQPALAPKKQNKAKDS